MPAPEARVKIRRALGPAQDVEGADASAATMRADGRAGSVGEGSQRAAPYHASTAGHLLAG